MFICSFESFKGVKLFGMEDVLLIKQYLPNKGKKCKIQNELIEACLLDKDGEPSSSS